MKPTKNALIFVLIGGVIFSSVVLWLLNLTVFGTYILYSFSSLLIFLAFACYPLAIMYGKDEIKRIYESMCRGNYRLFRFKSPYTAMLNRLIASIVTLFFGWIYGTYGAYMNMKYKKTTLRRIK